ncbi:YggS family pyridoxal phosphate-dependent enzyme [Dehalobacter sp. DCM]|uniref:YggS family pyridoxal phosphate-dependent enzyme n=1 Tax=Dehalobacter sp. DCM TaxID=2907827 RepID=UPI003082062B|nr:YggS family pyridoxal phosphate-dependent enzyme [Dehalobacter sp. DCM]
MSIAKNIEEVKQRVAAAAERSGRKPEDVAILAVSKTVSADRVIEAYEAGIRAFGENKVQEWQDKHVLLPGECAWHIIGRLQSNKVKYLDDSIVLIHSLDRISLLEKLHEEGDKRRIKWNTLVQVNVARDEAKAGLETDEVIDFLKVVKEYPNVRVHGLMTIGAFNAGPAETKGYFRKLREIRDDLQRKGIFPGDTLPHLSMGMSQDYEMAVEEGATIVRVGSVIFGHRN